MNKCRIANISIGLNGMEFEHYTRRFDEYLEDTQSFDINISYKENDEIVLPQGRLIKKIHRWHWIITDNNKYAAFQIHPITNKVVSLIITDREWKNTELQLCHFENDLGITNGLRSYINAGEIFSYALLRYNGLVLHSSAIDYNGNAVLFSAPPGTGKSTHTALWKKYYGDSVEIINDDAPAIRFVGNVPYAFGTPWSGKTEINSNISAPLRAVVFLERADDNKIQRIEGKKAVSLMLNETKKSVFPEMMELCLDTISKIISTTPVYLLSCNISRDSVDLVKSTLNL